MNSPSRNPVVMTLRTLGSLRLTVALLGMAIFLVFAGTLAQRFQGIWTVMEQYFRCWVSWIDFKIFFPREAHGEQPVPGGFPFPGGRLLGVALLANLLVSHTGRIRIPARGGRRLIGLATLAIGAVLTWTVIAHVFDADSSAKKIDPFWRVTMQLMQGGGAAAVLFVGCWLVFVRKAGIVLLHSGVIILMMSELSTSISAKETTMSIFEGQTINYVKDTRTVELAIVDGSDPVTDDVFVVPESLLRKGGTIHLEGLPFDLQVPEGKFMKNAGLRPARPADTNPATRGAGLQWIAAPHAEESGTDTEGRVDLPGVYVAFRERASGADLGTFLTALRLTMEKTTQILRSGGRDYQVSLRFERSYKPYSLYLYNFKATRYPGSEKPKDFSSFVRLEDPGRKMVRDVRIWMNNPLRYRGETFYQSSFDAVTEKGTVLQVVQNRGWMAPYVACMIVAVGLLGQFQLHLLEFLRKRRASS